MAEFAFVTLDEEFFRSKGMPVLPLPVRPSMQAEIYGPEGIVIDRLVDELRLYLESNPGPADFYRPVLGALAVSAGVALGQKGESNRAVAYFELALDIRPGDHYLRANLAVMLNLLGREEEALAHYDAIVNTPGVAVNPLIWVQAARLHSERGHAERALALLRVCVPLLPDAGDVHRFLEEMEKLAIVDLVEPEPGPSN
jgi:tetratricopeptide (TPR) repeat protein